MANEMANEKEEKTTLLDRLRKLLTPSKPAPTPEPAPAPSPKPDTQPSYLKAWFALRSIPVQKLWPLFFTVPVIVFLTISGLVAWLAVGFGSVIRILRLISGL